MTNEDDGMTVSHCLDGRREDVVVLVSPRDRECVLDAVKQRVPLLLDPPPAAVVIDLSGMVRLTSEAVAASLWTGAACRRRGIPVRLRHVPHRGATTLRRTGLSRSLALGGAEQ
jgi:ABC-type transporter Mla MlaB component